MADTPSLHDVQAENVLLREQIQEIQQANRDQERFFTMGVDILCVVDLGGTVLRINPTWQTMLGWSAEEVLGRNILDFMHPEDRPGAEVIARELMAVGGILRIENRYRHKDGSSRTLDWRAFVDTENEQVYSVGRDITDLRAQEQAMQRQAAELQTFQALADNATDSIGLLTADGTFAYANVTYRDVLGYGDALVGMSVFDLHADVPEYVRTRFAEALAQGTWIGMLTHRRVDGLLLKMQLAVFTIDTGSATMVGIIARDMSDQLRREEERAEMQAQVIDAQRAALRELSTPLIPLAKGVVVMPLIGAIDSARAAAVMETLLDGVAHHRARTAILDITGVQMIDTQVADNILRAAHAVRLLGSRVMLTGIQPDIAQTLVSLGVTMGDLETHSTLQAGIASALRLR